MPRHTASRVIGMWTRAMLDEVAPGWRTAEPPCELVDPIALRSDAPYIAHEDMVALWAHHTDRHADPLFGLHFAERQADHAVGMYAYVAAHAPDFETGARACVQVQRLIDTHSDIVLVDVDDGLLIRQRPPAGIGRWPRHLAESLASGCVHLGRQFTGVHIAPREVHYQHGPGGDASRWFGCPVRYEQPGNALVFDRATLALPFRHADATQFAAIVAAATRTLEAVVPASGILDDVRTALRARKGARTSLATLARVLRVSERTLQRRLGEAGATFRQLVDEVRVEQLAEHSLGAEKGTVTASALGYSNPSSLRRLRKRWRRARGSS